LFRGRRAQLAGRPHSPHREAAGLSLAFDGGMSQKSVEIVIGRLATDEALRARFLRDPASTLRALRETGLELNPGETEAPLQMTPVFLGTLATGVHPRLQKIDRKDDRNGR